MKNGEMMMKWNCGSRAGRVALRTRWLGTTTDWTGAECKQAAAAGASES